MPSLLDKGEPVDKGPTEQIHIYIVHSLCPASCLCYSSRFSAFNESKYKLAVNLAAQTSLANPIPPVCFPVPSDAPCTDKMDELADADVSRGPAEPAVKRERIEMSHPLQEM